MFVAAAILSGLLVVAALGAGIPKVRLTGEVPEQLQSHLGVSAGLTRFIGVAEVAAALGLGIGLYWHPLGIAAAAGLVIVFIGAVVYHLRAGDYAHAETRSRSMAPGVLAVIAVAAIVALTLNL